MMQQWSDSQFKLLIGGAVMLLGMLSALTVTVIGLVQGTATESIIAVGAAFMLPTTTGLGYFFGHSNGYKNGYKNGNGKSL